MFNAQPSNFRTLLVAQFANASGGTLVIGAEESGHVFQGFVNVSAPHEVVRWTEEAIKGNLTPVPTIEPVVLEPTAGTSIVVINVPPAPRIIARRDGDKYEFPVRAADSIRYMPLIEVEARMNDRERLIKLRLEEIPSDSPIWLDADLRSVEPDDWYRRELDDHTVTLEHGGRRLVIPLAYIDAVYPSRERVSAHWVISLSCRIESLSGGSGVPAHYRVRRYGRQ
jgi:hypothetical protein